MSFPLTTKRQLRPAVAVGSMLAAVLLTHVFWRSLQHTPFLLGFAAAILSAWVAGRNAALLAVAPACWCNSPAGG